MSNHHERPFALVLDWDGTVTERDGLHMAIERFGDLGVFDALEDELGKTLTLDEVIAAEMATIKAPLEEVRDWLVEHVRVRPGFRELVAEHEPLIVSSGFSELIEPILEREGVRARVVANHVAAGADGWRATFAEGPLCEVCGERCKRSAVGSLGRVRLRGRRLLRPLRRARRRACASHGTASRSGSTSRASPTSPSTTSTTCARRFACCRRIVPATAEGDDRRRALPRIEA